MRRPIRVFLVDESPDILRCFDEILREAEDIVVVGSEWAGQIAVRGILEQGPDVVVTDIWLAGLSGPMLVQKVRAELPEMRFIICASCEPTPYLQWALEVRAKGWITKPFRLPGPLAEAIREVR